MHCCAPLISTVSLHARSPAKGAEQSVSEMDNGGNEAKYDIDDALKDNTWVVNSLGPHNREKMDAEPLDQAPTSRPKLSYCTGPRLTGSVSVSSYPQCKSGPRATHRLSDEKKMFQGSTLPLDSVHTISARIGAAGSGLGPRGIAFMILVTIIAIVIATKDAFYSIFHVPSRGEIPIQASMPSKGVPPPNILVDLQANSSLCKATAAWLEKSPPANIESIMIQVQILEGVDLLACNGRLELELCAVVRGFVPSASNCAIQFVNETAALPYRQLSKL